MRACRIRQYDRCRPPEILHLHKVYRNAPYVESEEDRRWWGCGRIQRDLVADTVEKAVEEMLGLTSYYGAGFCFYVYPLAYYNSTNSQSTQNRRVLEYLHILPVVALPSGSRHPGPKPAEHDQQSIEYNSSHCRF